MRASEPLGLTFTGNDVNSGEEACCPFAQPFSFARLFLSLPIRSFGASESQTSSPDIKRIVIGQPLQPDDENQLVEVEGTVAFFGREGRAAYLQITSDSGYMQVAVQHGAGIMNDLLLNSRVRVRGICQPVHSVDGKMAAALLATNANDITILQVPEETWQRYRRPPSTLCHQPISSG